MLIQKTCQSCGNSFQYNPAKYKNPRRFCSRPCANKALIIPKETRSCLCCDKPFVCLPSSPRKYCSIKCSRIIGGKNQRKKYPVHQCVACGKEFEHKRGDTGGKYCSRLCSDKADRQVGRRLPRIKKTCLHCGKAFKCAPYHETDCCSRLCSNRHTALTQVGENHPLYKPKTEMQCEACGKICLVKPSLVSRFRACSRRCAAYLGQATWPRTSSIEAAVLSALRAINLDPQHQFSIPPYIVDIAFPDTMLAIECDGTYWHSTPKQKAKDRAKDKFLTNRGWRVIRLKEHEIKNSLDDCIARIIDLLTPAK